jgi:cell division protein ZapA (FtsZ GTPase activity inhibitor)
LTSRVFSDTRYSVANIEVEAISSLQELDERSQQDEVTTTGRLLILIAINVVDYLLNCNKSLRLKPTYYISSTKNNSITFHETEIYIPVNFNSKRNKVVEMLLKSQCV